MKTIQQTFGHKKYPRPFGVELEIECSAPISAPQDVLTPTDVDLFQKSWSISNDSSLRGFGYEFVSRSTSIQGDMFESLGILLEKNSRKINLSIRCGLHVHVNIQSFTLDELINFLVVYYLMENVITTRINNTRKGNLFCQRGRDMYNPLFQLLECGINKRGTLRQTWPSENSNKYSALNIVPVRNLGSVEFRFMEATTDTRLIALWAENLSEFVHRAKSINVDGFMSQALYWSNEKIQYQSLLSFFPKKLLDFFSNGGVGIDPIDSSYIEGCVFYAKKLIDQGKRTANGGGRFFSEREIDLGITEQLKANPATSGQIAGIDPYAPISWTVATEVDLGEDFEDPDAPEFPDDFEDDDEPEGELG